MICPEMSQFAEISTEKKTKKLKNLVTFRKNVVTLEPLSLFDLSKCGVSRYLSLENHCYAINTYPMYSVFLCPSLE